MFRVGCGGVGGAGEVGLVALDERSAGCLLVEWSGAVFFPLLCFFFCSLWFLRSSNLLRRSSVHHMYLMISCDFLTIHFLFAFNPLCARRRACPRTSWLHCKGYSNWLYRYPI